MFLTDIDEDGLNKTVDVITGAGGEVLLARAFDVGDYQAMRAFAADVHQRYGALDILINVAGGAFFSDRGHVSPRLGKSHQCQSVGRGSRPGMFCA